MKSQSIPLVSCILLCVACPSLIAAQAKGGTYSITLPDKRILVTVATGGELSYSVSVNGRQILLPSPISMTPSIGQILGNSAVMQGLNARTVDHVVRLLLPVKRAEVHDVYNARHLGLRGDYLLLVQVFNDGAACRFVTRLPGEITVKDEQVSFRFADDGVVWFPEEEGLMSQTPERSDLPI